MGWLWSSGSQPKGATPNTSSADAGNHATPSKTPEPEPAYADPEIAKFMAQLQSEFGSNSNSSSSNNKPTTSHPNTESRTDNTTSSSFSSFTSWWPSPASTSTPTTTTPQQPIPPPPPAAPQSQTHATTAPSQSQLDPVAESLLPTTMSCRQAFDHAFHCNSLGGQWTAVYRSGTVRSCSEPWDDFWFCMRTRAYSSPQKEEAIREHYRERELRKYGPGMPNSTDIWEPRAERLPPDEAAFNNDGGGGGGGVSRYQEPPISDDEWRRREIERRRAIRRLLEMEEAEATRKGAGR